MTHPFIENTVIPSEVSPGVDANRCGPLGDLPVAPIWRPTDRAHLRLPDQSNNCTPRPPELLAVAPWPEAPELVSPLPSNVVGFVERLDSNSGENPARGIADVTTHMRPAPLAEANVISSVVRGSDVMHKPVLDIDLPAHLIPSSTPGHYHLIIDKEIPWEQYKILLNCLSYVGVLEQGYVDASIDRGYTAVRLPWIRKGQPRG
jgi:hypothetical protein